MNNIWLYSDLNKFESELQKLETQTSLNKVELEDLKEKLKKWEDGIERKSKSLEEKRRWLDNREVCLKRNERDKNLENEKCEGDIHENEPILRIQKEDLNTLEIKIKEAKSQNLLEVRESFKLKFWINFLMIA